MVGNTVRAAEHFCMLVTVKYVIDVVCCFIWHSQSIIQTMAQLNIHHKADFRLTEYIVILICEVLGTKNMKINLLNLKHVVLP